MLNYHAEIVNMSLKDIDIIEDYELLNVKKRFLGIVKIYTIAIPEKEIDNAVILFQKKISNKLKKEWYITFHNNQNVIVVFRQRIFYLSGKGINPIYQQKIDTTYAEEKEKWNELLKYAKSLGIPDSQCDFLPENFDKIEY